MASPTTGIALGIFALLLANGSTAARAQAPIPAIWCTHATAQRLAGDVNGDGQEDAVCHDKVTGRKWVALWEPAGLVERWVDDTIGWCRHSGATLHIGDVNGDHRADLICKDSARIWVDLAGADFFRGTDFSLDTAWCTHLGAAFFVGDQNGDGRADLVCQSSDGSHTLDFADSAGRFGGTDVQRLSPDFRVVEIARSSGEHRITVVNRGAAGIVTRLRCQRPGEIGDTGALAMPAFSTRIMTIRALPLRPGKVECSVVGEGTDGLPELFVSNNSFSVRFP